MSELMAEMNSMMLLGLFDAGSLFCLGLLAVLLFGGDLPKMGRKFGKIYSEFQRSVGAFKKEVSSVVSDITSDIENPLESSGSSSRSVARAGEKVETSKDEDEVEVAAPKFEPPKLSKK